MIRLSSLLVLACAATVGSAAAREPDSLDPQVLGSYVLRGRYDGGQGASSEALLKIERYEDGRLVVSRTEVVRGEATTALVWWADTVRVVGPDRLEVRYAPAAESGPRRGAAGALAGVGGAAAGPARNTLSARYVVREGKVTEAVLNRTRQAPEEGWRRLDSVGRRGRISDLRSVRTIVQHGAPEDRLDLVLVPEGYRPFELPVYDAQVRAVVAELQRVTPFRELWKLFNVHVVRFADEQRGLGGGTLAGSRLGSGDYPSVEADGERVRRLARLAPAADAVVVLGNASFRSRAWEDFTLVSGYGSDVAGTAVHELGHVVGRLLDEYEENARSAWDYVYGNGISEWLVGQTGWGGNVTTHTDRRFVPWRHWLPEGARLPTPTGATPEVGLFKGALHFSRRWYRPSEACMMRDARSPFCAVCRELLTIRIAAQAWPVQVKRERLDRDTWRLTLTTDLPTPSQVVWLRNGMVQVATGPTYVARRKDQPWGESTLDAIVQLATPLVRNDPEGATTFRMHFRMDKGRLWSRGLKLSGPSRRRGWPDAEERRTSPF